AGPRIQTGGCAIPPDQASLPVVPFHSLNHPAKPKRTWNHWEVVQLCKCPNDSRVEALRSMLQQELHKAADIASLNQLLISCAAKVFPPVKGQQRLATWQQPCMNLGIKGMWQARRTWKYLAQTQPDQVLRISRAHQAFKQAHKAFKQAGKACKKQRFYDKIDELQAAAGRGDTRSLYAGVRAIAPKKAKTKVQLRDDKGQLQSAGDQIRQLETYYRRLYAADEDPAVAGEARAPVHIRIDPGQMTKALSQLSPHKATPPGKATNSLWRLTADLVAPTLCDMASSWRQIPADWRDAWLVLVPKVPRQECRPASAPHFAGVQLSLDLSNAFDLLNWRLIDRALLDAGVDPELRNQVMSWYHEVTYHIEHLSKTAQVTARKGLRQGCQLAPILWAMGMGYVFKSVATDTTNQVTTAWLQSNTTTYADDIHLMEVARTSSHLDRILHKFGTMLDALVDNDMLINAAKSAVLLRHRGSFIKKWLRRHKQHTSEGDLLYLRTPKGREFRFPMRDQHTYLGVKISYHAMARHTTQYRLQVANQAWQRLRGVLCSSGRLALAHRISLWKATVLPTLMYGLAAVDPELKERIRLQSLILKHVRAMAKSYAHMQHESSCKVLQRCGVLSAQAQLQKETEGLLKRLRAQAETTSLVPESHLEALRMQAASYQAADMMGETEKWTPPLVRDFGSFLRSPFKTGLLYTGIAIKMRSTKIDTGINVKYLASVPSFMRDMSTPMTSFAEAMDMDEQEKLFFGQLGPVKREPQMAEASANPLTLGPAKRQRLEPQDRSKGKGGKGKNKGKGKGHPLPGAVNTLGGGSECPQPRRPLVVDGGAKLSANDSQRESADWMEHRLTQLTHLVLRQEQVLTHLRQDMMLYLFVRSGDKGMIPVMCQAADKWRQLKEESPEKLQMSLKLAMFKQLLISLYERLTTTQQDAQAMAHAKSLGWLDEDQSWRILRWSPAQQCLEVDQSCQPVPTKDLLDQITNVRKAINEDNLLRFKSLRRLSPDVTAEWIQFQIAISLRMDAPGSSNLRLADSGSVELCLSAVPNLRALLRASLHNVGNTGACYKMGGQGNDR
ncbi:unnamed protein product, partial [Symbiodinium microadriaticum]